MPGGLVVTYECQQYSKTVMWWYLYKAVTLALENARRIYLSTGLRPRPATYQCKKISGFL